MSVIQSMTVLKLELMRVLIGVHALKFVISEHAGNKCNCFHRFYVCVTLASVQEATKSPINWMKFCVSIYHWINELISHLLARVAFKVIPLQFY